LYAVEIIRGRKFVSDPRDGDANIGDVDVQLASRRQVSGHRRNLVVGQPTPQQRQQRYVIGFRHTMRVAGPNERHKPGHQITQVHLPPPTVANGYGSALLKPNLLAQRRNPTSTSHYVVPLTVMRTVFHNQLDALARSIADMCDLAGTAMQQATEALLDADIVLAETVISDHQNLVFEAAQAESDAFSLLALQAPVAADLRAVVSCMKDVADVERMGALALHVAKTVRRRHPAHAIPADVNVYFAEMGRIAVNISRNAKEAVVSGDPDKAAQLAHDDGAMDALHSHLFTILMDRQWSVSTAVDITLLSRYYERFADHAVEIGRRVIFQATGVITT
jgi:phosphate transport system protein